MSVAEASLGARGEANGVEAEVEDGVNGAKEDVTDDLRDERGE